MNLAAVVAVLGLLVFLAHALSALFARTRIPDVLLLLVLGLLLGPVAGLVRPEALGAVGPVFTTATLIVILFEGGLGLDLALVAKSMRGATGLTLWNFAGTLLVLTPLAHAFLGFTWLQAATLAACLGGTSSAVVIPLVRRLSVGPQTSATLALESALSDVLVIVAALGLMDAQAEGSLSVPRLLGAMTASFAVSVLAGLAAGLLWSLVVRKVRALQHSIFTTPAFVFVVYGAVELAGFSGAIAALVMGIALGNVQRLAARLRGLPGDLAKPLPVRDRQVFAEVVFLMKTFLFVYIGVSMRLSGPATLLAGALVAALLFLVRFPAVHLSLAPSGTTRFDAAMCGAMGAKGLAAAVVASIPVQMGLPRGQELQLLVFASVLATIVATAGLVLVLERRWLPRPQRWLFGRYPDVKL